MTEVPHEAEAKLGLNTPPPPAPVIDDRPHHTLTEHERVARTKALEHVAIAMSEVKKGLAQPRPRPRPMKDTIIFGDQ